MSKSSLLLLLLLLSGCFPSLESTAPPDRIYWLEASDAAGAVSVDLMLRVVPGLDSDRIWVLQQDQRLNYYAGAYWADTLEPLLGSVLDRSLNGPGSSGGTVEVEILVERFFAIERGAESAPDVTLKARLQAAALSCVFAETTRAAGARLRDIVAAHQQLVDGLAEAAAQFAAAPTQCP